jgi:hypothetical protein
MAYGDGGKLPVVTVNPPSSSAQYERPDARIGICTG